ncbi:uncharacterized protein LOC116110032 [Pistacia vera]|uniref:uncharacterized protein LOC116110032 n=2 Tax=Pistacia vera TaxID=55513 RepID=UPI0012636078|nr:uncharacterized protein LOC116110032 [Pistacia vera]
MGMKNCTGTVQKRGRKIKTRPLAAFRKQKIEKNETKTIRKKIKMNICYNQRPWADLREELLNIISSNLNIADYLSIGRVCRSWRLFNSEYEDGFMASKSPLVIHISSQAKKACCFHEIATGIKYKTMLPNFICDFKFCLGVSGGYLIMKDTWSQKIWLINPVTGRQFQFSRVRKLSDNIRFSSDRAIFASTGSQDQDFVVVILSCRNQNLEFYTSRNNQWKEYSFKLKNWHILDMVVFCGRIFAITNHSQIGILDLRNFDLKFLTLKFAPRVSSNVRLVTSNNNILIVDYVNVNMIKVYSINVKKMEWVVMNNLGQHAVCVGDGGIISCKLIDPTKWGGQSNCVYVLLNDGCHIHSLKNGEVKTIRKWRWDDKTRMYSWYFFSADNVRGFD